MKGVCRSAAQESAGAQESPKMQRSPEMQQSPETQGSLVVQESSFLLHLFLSLGPPGSLTKTFSFFVLQHALCFFRTLSWLASRSHLCPSSSHAIASLLPIISAARDVAPPIVQPIMFFLGTGACSLMSSRPLLITTPSTLTRHHQHSSPGSTWLAKGVGLFGGAAGGGWHRWYHGEC